jgi:Carboxypeptidase regulatory-like domain/TonB dependent receptor/TonB-dependent Receptor Plug Domain
MRWRWVQGIDATAGSDATHEVMPTELVVRRGSAATDGAQTSVVAPIRNRGAGMIARSAGTAWRTGLLGAVLCALATSGAAAQTSTGIIRGKVVNETGAPVVSAEVIATNVETGAQRRTTSSETGQYVLAGLQPASYQISVETLGYNAQTRTVRVLIGQSLTVDLELRPQALELAGITVIGERVAETRTSEVATNVTQEQIQSLPQQDRNFLNFAGLAPGVTVSRNELNKNISAGGLPASRINVFVDGASYKNDLLEGGVLGQDASRGNPFPQIAIQEFRVITQNFKAEYQKASSAIVTATTKSGTNEFRIDGFMLGQNKNFVETNPGAEVICARRLEEGQSCDPKPEYERFQMGISAGGPILRDRLHYFAAYENNIQDRQAIVALTRAEFRDEFGEYEGTFDQPFRSHLGVAKLTWQPAENQTLDLSWNGRFESDRRDFGGIRSFEAAEDVRIRHNVLNVKHGMTRGDWFNEAQISGQRSTWNPTVVNDDLEIGREYMGVIVTGARSTEQRFVQDRLAFRNDLTRHGITWNGEHVFKSGVNVDLLNYDVQKRQDGNPTFFFDVNQSLTAPAWARWGSGDPGMEESNVQFGAYIQDDWDVTSKLQLNLGVRWDAETNMFNNNWVTPDSIRTALGPILTAAGKDSGAYFTSGGEDRPMYLGAFQPRVGFSYDVRGDGATVLHGGFGVYYDREIWNHLIDERFRLNWIVRFFDFTTTGDPNRIPWDPSYESVEGLQGLVDAAGTGVNPGITSEVWLLENDSKPPRSNQWNLGIRQGIAGMMFGAAYRGVRGENLTSWYCAKAHSVHGFCEGTHELGSRYKVLLSTDQGTSSYDALDLTADKPFTEDSRWGFTLAYTLAASERKGWDFFSWDFGDDPNEWESVDAGAEKHRVVASAIVGLPYDFRLSTLAQWGSGVPFSRKDESAGWGPARVQVDWYSEDSPDFKQVDLRLQKDFLLPNQSRVGLVIEGINIFDTANYRSYQEIAAFQDRANDDFGKPNLDQADLGRRLQLGLNVGIGGR